MSYSTKDFIDDIKEILAICKEELRDISKGKPNQATKEQIEGTIIPEMNNLLEMIQKNEMPPKDQRWILSAAYITRGWNWDIWSEDRLTTKLPQLDDKYRYELE
ncbi:MAG: hypothetical protein WC996_09330 [Peptostreptococcales bacterium]